MNAGKQRQGKNSVENAIDIIPKKLGKNYRTKNLKDLKTRSKD